MKPSWFNRLSGRWWFYILLLLCFFLPAYTAVPFNPADTSKLIGEVLPHPLIYTYPALFPLFKLVPLLLIAALAIWGNRARRWFTGYAALSLLAFAVLQNAAFTVHYGFAVITGNLVVFTVLAIFWLAETLSPKSDFTPEKRGIWSYWPVPLALLAFWYPVNTAAPIPAPNFSLAGLFANEAGLTFCMMLPVYQAVLLVLAHPARRTLLRVSGFVGLVTALFNGIVFLTNPAYGPWMAFLHLPLLVLSLVSLLVSRAPSTSPQAARPLRPAGQSR